MGYVVYGLLGIFAAYLLYSLMSIVLATNLPIVVVISGSMDHGETDAGLPCGQNTFGYVESFDNWWELCRFYYEQLDITKEQFSQFPASDGFKKGDMPMVMRDDEYVVGDVVVYSVQGESAPIIHRIVAINDDGTYQTKGDHNSGQNSYEKSISESQIHGKVIFIIPKLGYLKVLFADIAGV